MLRPRSRHIFATSLALPSKDMKSLSKISTASKPAAAIACSFLSKVPLTETVAIGYFMIGHIPHYSSAYPLLSHRPSVSSVTDLRHGPQLIWRSGSKPEKFQISGDLFEQHVGTDLKFAAARACCGEEGSNLILHHHFADECRRCNAGNVHRQRVTGFHAEWRSIYDDIVASPVDRADRYCQDWLVSAQTLSEIVHHRRISIEQRKFRYASLGKRR